MLVERGADVDAYNVYRDTLDCVTPLHFAVYKNKLSTVRLLLRMGADPTLFGRWGRAEGTPIQFARLVAKGKIPSFRLCCQCQQKIIGCGFRALNVLCCQKDNYIQGEAVGSYRSGPLAQGTPQI